MQIQVKKLTLEGVYKTFSHFDTILLHDDIQVGIEKLENSLLEYKILLAEGLNVASQIDYITKQMAVLNDNLRVTEVAILCHETKVFEKKNAVGINFKYCLN